MSPTRTLRRIQIIVAMMMVLSMLVGSPIAQARVYGPNLPTLSSPSGATTENDSGAVLTSSQALTVTFGIPVVSGQTVLGTEMQIRARRLGGDGWVSTRIQNGTGSGSSSYLTSTDTWSSNSWAVHSYPSNEDDALRQYVQDAAGGSDITFRVRRTDGTRSIEIDWVKLAVTTAEPTEAPPMIVGNCSPANIHLVVDNSASIGSSLDTMKANIKSFMATAEAAVPGTNWNVTKFWGDHSASSSGWRANPTDANSFIDGMTSLSNSYTPTASGIQQARNQGIPSGTASLPKIMIILTDGAPNRPLDSSVSSGFYYYRGAADAVAQADGARTDGWSTILVAIGGGDSYAPDAPYAANVSRGLAGIDVDGPAGDLMTTGFSGLGDDLTDLLASGCAINLDKTVDLEVALPGTVVQYTYTVSNPMSVDLTGILLSDDKCSPISTRTVISGNSDSTLNPAEVWQYTCSQAITVDTVNTAVVTGTTPMGSTVRDQDTAEVTVLPLGSLAVRKLVDWNGVPVDTSQTFAFTITGPSYPSGDSKSVEANGGIAPWSDLVPGVYTVTETYPGSAWTVTPGLSQQVAVPADGGSITATVTNTRVQDPGLDLTKVADPTATDPEGVVTYTLYYTNSGNIALTNVTLVDDPDETYVANIDNVSDGGLYDDEISWTIGSLAAGASGSVTYEATMKGEADFDPGDTPVHNTAVITSTESDPASDNATVVVTLEPDLGLSLVKEIATSASGPWQESITVLAGTDVYYRFTVANTGNVTVTDMAIVDPDVDVTGAGCPTALGRGASAECVVGPVTALPAQNVNTATATGLVYGEVDIESNEDIATYIGLSPDIVVVKTADPTAAYPGDTVTYGYVVTNTGAVTLTGVVLDDDKLGAITLSASALEPGESATGTSSYTVQAGDASPIVNTANVTGTATVGDASRDVSDTDDATVYVILPGSITIIKDAGGDTTAAFGFTLDRGVMPNVLPRDGALPVVFTLRGGESATYELEPGVYTVVESWLPEGWVPAGIACTIEGGEGQIEASQLDGNGVYGHLEEGQTVVCTFSNRYPALSLAKEVGTSAAGPWQEAVTVQVGSAVYYRLTVTNSGNVTLTDVSIVDPDVDASGCAWPTELAPGASAACVVGPVSALLGKHVNTAQATAFYPELEREVPSNEDSAAYIGVQPGLAIEKSVAPANAAPGDVVAYTIAYSNTGTMGLTGVTIVDDPDETYVAGISGISGGGAYDGDEITWAIGSLAAGASGAVTYQATLKGEEDFALGQTAVDNVAVIASNETDPVQDDATVIVTRLLNPEPGLSIVKVGSTTAAHIGDTVAYTITVRNTGNITLTNVTVVDAKLGIDENVGALAPGASAQVTGAYAVTEADLGGIVNVAVADSDQTEPVDDTWTVEVITGPALAIDKVGSTTAAQLGDTVAYTITVQNTGNITLTNVTVVDAKLGINQNVGSLAPGASAQVTGSYLVTVADLGGIANTAVADSDQTEPVQDTWNVTVGMAPGLLLVKTVNTPQALVGDLITYTLTVTNIGDVALTDVTIVDPLLGVSHNVGGLAVGQSRAIQVPYTVKDADLGTLHNVATATGKDPAGKDVSDEDDATVIVEREYKQPPTPVPCVRSDVAVVVYGGWNGIPVRAWVGGTEQQTLTTAVDAFGQQQVMWTFYPPANTSWSVSVQPQTPEGKDPARWQYKLLRIESASQGTVNNNPGSASVSITRCNQHVLYFQLMDNGITPPSQPQLPVTGGGPEPILAGGLGLFAALSGLGWSMRRRRSE